MAPNGGLLIVPLLTLDFLPGDDAPAVFAPTARGILVLVKSVSGF
jgi:hypothetical protein